MRVLYFHQYFSTRDGTTGTRSYEFARRLVQRGHQVTMVCGYLNGANGVFSGMDRSRVNRVSVDGIDVIELGVPYSNHLGLRARTKAFLRFALRSVRIALKEDYDVLFATSTPLTVALPGIAMKLRFWKRRPFVFEVRDLWPELPRAMGGVPAPILWGMAVLERAAYFFADGAVGLAPGIVDGIRKKARAQLPVELVPNACDVDVFRPGERVGLHLDGVEDGDCVALFTGTHGKANGLHSALDAAAVLKQRGRNDIKLVFVGDGMMKPSLVERARMEGLDNCLFLDTVPKTRLAVITGVADVGLMILENVPEFYRGTSPNKFFDYIAAGLPVLNNYPGWLAELIERSDCGIAVPPGDAEAFASALEALANSPQVRARMGANARKLAEDEFNREILAGRFADFVEKIAAKRSVSRLVKAAAH
jgi:glycosyltransferase involved in cell wall biosynthesis